MKWKAHNIPVPEPYLLALIAGIILHFIIPLKFIAGGWPLIQILGGIILASGIFLAGWAVGAFKVTDMKHPKSLITHGPYRLSRNPMYLAWMFILLGTSFILASLWLLALLFIASMVTHFYIILPEEREMINLFGEEYMSYKKKVRRYI